jgi:hypothetical protein
MDLSLSEASIMPALDFAAGREIVVVDDLFGLDILEQVGPFVADSGLGLLEYMIQWGVVAAADDR